MKETMPSRARWLAALDNQPVDRLPFWPKVNGAYARAQKMPFADMTPDAIHDWIGSDKHIGIAHCAREKRTRTSLEIERQGDRRIEKFITPHGTLDYIMQFDEASQSWHPVKMPVSNVDDIRILKEWFDDVSVELDRDTLAESGENRKRIGESAVVACTLGTTALMDWIEHIAGVENGHYLLIDSRDEVEALFDAMHNRLRRRAEIILSHTPADMFYLLENTSTTLLSPEQFRTYCFPHLRDIAELAAANGKRLVLHMCGLLKELLPDLRKLPVAAFEAFTSPPVGNTTLVDGRTVCPDTCLIGGTNAALWTYPAATIIAELACHLEALPHHRGLVITSAGVMPPRASPQTIKAVGDWVKNYPVKL